MSTKRTNSSKMSGSQHVVDKKMKINFDQENGLERSLALVMSHLPIVDRIKCERVSKKWKSASASSWRTYKLLNLAKKNWGLTSKDKTHKTRKVTYKMLTSVLKKCGKFLLSIDFEDIDNSNYEVGRQSASQNLLSLIARYCKNLKSLKINSMEVCTFKGLTDLATNCKELSELLIGDSSLYEDCTYCDSKLADIFSKCKIASIEIIFLPITGKCLSSLNKNLLHTIQLMDCKYVEPRYLIELIFSAKNLSNFSIRSDSYIMQVIKALQKNCNNLTNLTLLQSPGSSEDVEDIDEELSTLFKNCNKLKSFTTAFCKLNGSCFLDLKDAIEEIKIHFCSNIEKKYLIECFPKLKNLNDLSYDSDFEGNIAESLSFCTNLKNLRINISSEYVSVANGVTPLSSLKNLESLNLGFSNYVTDEFLISISDNLKKLSYIDINSCKNVTDLGLKAVTALPNLEGLNVGRNSQITDNGFSEMQNIRILKISECKNLTTDKIIDIIKKSNKLVALDVTGCKSITNELINSAIEITNNRIVKIMLEIYVENTGINVKQISGRSPFLELNTNWSCHRWRNRE